MWLRRVLVGLSILLILSGTVSFGWSAEVEPARFEDVVDLLVLRPFGCLVTIAGAGLFVLTLPFTVPTHSVNKSAEGFVVAPFRYTFSRPFPDRNL
jgi:hypothetical protein